MWSAPDGLWWTGRILATVTETTDVGTELARALREAVWTSSSKDTLGHACRCIARLHAYDAVRVHAVVLAHLPLATLPDPRPLLDLLQCLWSTDTLGESGWSPYVAWALRQLVHTDRAVRTAASEACTRALRLADGQAAVAAECLRLLRAARTEHVVSALAVMSGARSGQSSTDTRALVVGPTYLPESGAGPGSPQAFLARDGRRSRGHARRAHGGPCRLGRAALAGTCGPGWGCCKGFGFRLGGGSAWVDGAVLGGCSRAAVAGSAMLGRPDGVRAGECSRGRRDRRGEPRRDHQRPCNEPGLHLRTPRGKRAGGGSAARAAPAGVARRALPRCDASAAHRRHAAHGRRSPRAGRASGIRLALRRQDDGAVGAGADGTAGDTGARWHPRPRDTCRAGVVYEGPCVSGRLTGRGRLAPTLCGVPAATRSARCTVGSQGQRARALGPRYRATCTVAPGLHHHPPPDQMWGGA
jgi:hypothetical protein